jgi:putative ABC transport system substrate-binding protein
VHLEDHWVERGAERLREAAAELVRRQVDVIVAADTPMLYAAQQATHTIPIVGFFGVDPVAEGLVASLARPGGNLTGVSGMIPELSSKLLELLKEAVPGVTRVAILTDGVPPMLQDMERAAQTLGVHTYHLVVGYPDQFEPAFTEAIREGAGALVILPSVLFVPHLQHIAALALQHRLPAIFWQRRFAEVGGLMTYGPSWPHLWQRAAAQVDKILKGSRPADLPVEQPMKLERVINLKTAKQLGFTIPPTLLFQADEVIR